MRRKVPVTTAVDMRARYKRLQKAACEATKQAMNDGTLCDPATLKCVDCGAPAYCYDHRDYRKPLMVDAVCTGCNLRRGPGLPWFPRREKADRDHAESMVGVAFMLTQAEFQALRQRLREDLRPDGADSVEHYVRWIAQDTAQHGTVTRLAHELASAKETVAGLKAHIKTLEKQILRQALEPSRPVAIHYIENARIEN